ncbi:MAG: cytidylate kinase-like family protein [Deltaproteobacteria bacterium]|nr:MAG: cytidylate kinase-like family protein [Deltaproteobacteria bacterium]
MSVITISRQFGAGAEEVALALSEKLGYRIVGRSEVEEKTREITSASIPESLLVERGPGIIERFTFDREIARLLLEESVLSFAKEGRCIILGRGGFAFLRDVPGVLNVLVVGEWEKRAEFLAGKEQISSLDARTRIEKVYRERRGFLSYFLETSWGDPSHFHLTINPLDLGFEEGATLLESVVTGLELEKRFAASGEKAVREKLGRAKVLNRSHFSLGVHPSLLSVRFTGEETVTVWFFNVEEEKRDAVLSLVREEFPGYTVEVKG